MHVLIGLVGIVRRFGDGMVYLLMFAGLVDFQSRELGAFVCYC